MQELTNAVNTALQRIIASDTIEKAIEAQLTNTIQAEIKSQLREYSDFGKQLEAAVKDALKVDFSNLGLPGYGDMILKIVRKQAEEQINAELARSIESRLTDILQPPPATINLSTLVEQYIEHCVENARHSCSCDDTDRITLIVETSQYGSRWVYLDPDEGTDKYECKIRFLVGEKGGKISALKMDGSEVGNKLFVGKFYRFERTLFQLHAAGTELVIDGDEHSISTYYPGRGD